MTAHRSKLHAGDGRYAPSPSGDLHLGSLRTAMVAWLFARSQSARLMLRIDDIDPDRSREAWVERQLADLRAIGVDWDDEPVRQTQRFDRYADSLDELRTYDLLYPCFCTRADVRAAATAAHSPLPDGAYPGTCTVLAPSSAQQRIDNGEEHCLRVRAEGVTFSIDDELHGAASGVVDDFVVRRRDGVPAYNLATVVDDHDMRVEQVVRGDDLLESTPRQAWLASILGFRIPRFAHVPLVLGDDGARLAKRHGSVTLADRLSRGETPAQVRGLLAASLGLCEPGETPDMAELLARFEPANLPRIPTSIA
jgi:glutamyl-tRNA synthetase